jgi:hypothetical protein
MKTPRDILFARHQAAMPKLDAIRQSTVAAVCDRRISTDCAHERRSQTAVTTQNRLTPLVTSLLCCSNKLWLELIWPCRRIWTGLATVWILIFVANVSMHDGSQTVIAKSSTTEMIMTFRDQQKFLNELFADRSLPADAGRPRIFSPKPRTESMRFLTA